MTVPNRAILNVAEEVFCKPTAREPKDTVEAIWGQIFAVSSAAPNLMQKIQGRRLSPTELRFVLLSAMLCSAISETCSNRRTYIGRIMELPKQVQHCLMTLIESFPRSQVGMTPSKSPQSTPTTKERTPKTTPSRSAVEATPKSAAARKNSGQPSTPGPTPGRRVGFSSPPAYGVQSTEKDLISILAWIRTIPLFNGMTGLTNTAVFSDRKVVR